VSYDCQWSNYSIVYEGPENMASDSEPGKFFIEAPSEVTFREAKSLYSLLMSNDSSGVEVGQ